MSQTRSPSNSPHLVRQKVLVCRDLGPDVMPLLRERTDIEVIVNSIPGVRELRELTAVVQLVVWPEDRACDRKWLLQNVSGAVGVIVVLTEKVRMVAKYIVGCAFTIVLPD
jgi:glyoxylate/hydroxypyruvate reductase